MKSQYEFDMNEPLYKNTAEGRGNMPSAERLVGSSEYARKSLCEHYKETWEPTNKTKSVNMTEGTQKSNRKIRTIGIISAEKPTGQVASNEYRKPAPENMIKNLKIGHYQYFITQGMYGSAETSVMVYNISLSDLIKLCHTYNQESMAFIDMTNGNEVTCQYWEGEGHNFKLKFQHEEHRLIEATDDEDFYTQISREFKFRIPVFECAKNTISLINSNNVKYDVNKLIDECIDNKYTGKHKYVCRCKLYETK